MDTSLQPVIQVKDLTAAYEGSVILQSVSFEIFRGEVFIILGGSGCGKSTLLKHLIGLYRPVAGTILLEGLDLVRTEGRARLRLLEKIGVMYQSGALFGSLSLIENVRLPLEEHTDLPEEAIEMVARMKLKLVGLHDFRLHMPSELSGGMQKRAAIARAMALDPQILFLDEPSAGLDPITSADLDQLILRLARSLKITFVIVSHELASIDAIADRVILLDRRVKGIVATGHPQDLRRSGDPPYVRQFFNREPTSEEVPQPLKGGTLSYERQSE